MKIYHNSQYKSKLRMFVFKNNGGWLNFLIGVNLEEDQQGDIHIYPVYRGVRLVRMPDCQLIEIPIFQKGLLIVMEKWRLRILLLDANELVGLYFKNPEN